MQRQRAVGALVINALVWGVSWWPFRALTASGLHSVWATAFVYGVSLVVVALSQPRACAQALRAPAVWLIALAAGSTSACFNWAVSEGDVVRVVLLFYLMPVWSMLLARVLLGEPLRAAAALRAALAVTGAVLVLGADGAAAWPVPRSRADWLAVAGGMWFALANVMLRREAARPNAVRALGMFAGGALVPGALAVALSAAGTIAPPAVPVTQWLAGALALAGAFLVANFALQYGAARLPASVTALVMLSEVLFASASAIVLGAADWSGSVLAGAVLIVAASLLAATEPSRLRPAKDRQRLSCG